MANITLRFRPDTSEIDIRISFLYKGLLSVLYTNHQRLSEIASPNPLPANVFLGCETDSIRWIVK